MDGGAIPSLGQPSVRAAKTPFSFFSMAADRKSFLTNLVLLGPSTTAISLGRAIFVAHRTILVQLLLKSVQVLQYVAHRTISL